METKYLIGAGVLFALALTKNYFNGVKCRVSRDLTGQVAVITGGNTGIGKETALELAKMGCTVIIGARDVEKSRLAVKHIRSAARNDSVDYEQLDLGSKRSIERFAESIKVKYGKVDILVNNAGLMGLPERQLSKEGYEMQMAVNHLGHFYLTYLLWDILKNSENLRIINVSSKSHLRNYIDSNAQSTIDFNTMDGSYPGLGMQHGRYHPMYAYSASKMANVLFTQQLATRLALVNPNARVISLHPGVVRSELSRYFFKGFRRVLVVLLYPVIWMFTKSSWHGAQTTLYGILEDKEKIRNGSYYAECKLSVPASFAMDPLNRKRLWQKSEEMMNIKFDAV